MSCRITWKFRRWYRNCIYLRKGVRFHDGTDFNANAVLFSFARRVTLSTPIISMVSGLIGAICL